MSWIKCRACDGLGEIYAFWSDPINQDIPHEECPTCHGKKIQSLIGSISMTDDWMPTDWRKGIDPIKAIRKKIWEDCSQIPHDELAVEYEKLAVRCELLWKDHCVMQDKIKNMTS